MKLSINSLAGRQASSLLTRSIARSSVPAVRRNLFAQAARRFNSTSSEAPKSKPIQSSISLAAIAGVALVGGASYYFLSDETKAAALSKVTAETATYEDYQKVYNAIAQKLIDEDEYDDGSYAPILIRLAWHSSGTYSASAHNGGSNAASMRFKPESAHGANAGLEHARNFLESIQKQFPWISTGDLWTLAGVTAIQEMSGPTIEWRSGRVDGSEKACTPDGRLPDASQGQDHIRKIFYTMGFNDQEIVALIGAHAVGRCHTDRSGFDGPWTFSPTVFTNDFYKLLLNEKWEERNWDGPKQYEDVSTKSLMMLPSDYALIQDKQFKKYVEKYAKDCDLFFKDFATVFQKLLELGVDFKPGSTPYKFKTLDAQGE
ncbi:heme peroxidase [Nadsonia fulvescens var. elongata DSM 6958]|uniref:Peroxidase n=1 Tax=Nadsonia fulvescens var. elongata DSM 6958 TaxID=857566 RepID=A0A1E3PE10_9ASCO|nr:heme peroxidase [Nadsonia fulvescens var. elongata DSM 6958]